MLFWEVAKGIPYGELLLFAVQDVFALGRVADAWVQRTKRRKFVGDALEDGLGEWGHDD